MADESPAHLAAPLLTMTEKAFRRIMEGPQLSAADYVALSEEITALRAALAAREREKATLAEFIEREGYRRCDIAACNCNSWHGGRASDRLREISELLADADVPGGTTIYGGVMVLRERAETVEAQVQAARRSALEEVYAEILRICRDPWTGLTADDRDCHCWFCKGEFEHTETCLWVRANDALRPAPAAPEEPRT